MLISPFKKNFILNSLKIELVPQFLSDRLEILPHPRQIPLVQSYVPNFWISISKFFGRFLMVKTAKKKFKNFPKEIVIEIKKFRTQDCTSGIWHAFSKISSRSDKNWGTSSFFSEFNLKYLLNGDISKISVFY